MRANTRGALIRGASTQDGFGDEIETTVADPAFADFPFFVVERGQTVFDPGSNEWRTIRKLVGRIPATIPVDEGSRIRDNRDGTIYAVEGFTREARGLSGRSSVSLTLKRTSP